MPAERRRGVAQQRPAGQRDILLGQRRPEPLAATRRHDQCHRPAHGPRLPSGRTLARFQPVAFDPGMVDLVGQTATDLGFTTRRMPSGAGHDAQMLARICPTSMIFVPSVDGLSHNIAEYTTPADVTAGADVLLRVVLAKADER